MLTSLHCQVDSKRFDDVENCFNDCPANFNAREFTNHFALDFTCTKADNQDIFLTKISLC